MNWIKGFDRVALLLAIPIAVLGFSYSSKQYAKKKAVYVWLTDEEEAAVIKNRKDKQKWIEYGRPLFPERETPFGYAGEKGVIANGDKELKKIKESDPILKSSLEEAMKDGGDPKGMLVSDNYFNMEYSNTLIYLIPSSLKRYIVGVLGAIGFGVITVLSVGLLTRLCPKAFKMINRVFKWIKDGFFKEA
jgi:hypothetical protein